MSAFVLRVRDTLNEVASDWQWSFSSSIHRGENKFKFVATHKYTGAQRTVYLAENVTQRLPLKVIVHDIIHLLPLKLTALTVNSDHSIDVRRNYVDLRADYRLELEKVRRLAKNTHLETPLATP